MRYPTVGKHIAASTTAVPLLNVAAMPFCLKAGGWACAMSLDAGIKAAGDLLAGAEGSAAGKTKSLRGAWQTRARTAVMFPGAGPPAFP